MSKPENLLESIKSFLRIKSNELDYDKFPGRINVILYRFNEVYAIYPVLIEDITDWKSFLFRIRDDNNETVRSFTKLLNSDMRKVIYEWNCKEEIDSAIKERLIQNINSILSKMDFYNNKIHSQLINDKSKEDFIYPDMAKADIDYVRKSNRILLGRIFPESIRNIHDYERADIAGIKDGINLIIDECNELAKASLSEENPIAKRDFGKMNVLTSKSAGLLIRVVLDDEWNRNYARKLSRKSDWTDDQNKNPQIHAVCIEQEGSEVLQLSGTKRGILKLSDSLREDLSRYSFIDSQSSEFSRYVTDNSVQLNIYCHGNGFWNQLCVNGDI